MYCSVLEHKIINNLKVTLFLERYCRDWDDLAIKKPFTVKECYVLHSCCGMFLHFIGQLEISLPGSAFPAAREKRLSQFLMGGLDSELQCAAETSVPPGDLKAVGAFRWPAGERK